MPKGRGTRRWFNWLATDDGKYQETWVVGRDGNDKLPADRTPSRICFVAERGDLILTAHRNRKGNCAATYRMPKHPTRAQIARVIEHLRLYGTAA